MFLNQVFYTQEDEVKPLFIDEIREVYVGQAELSYVPYSNYVKDLDYLNFLMPSIEGLRALKTDYYTDEHFEVWISGQYLIYEVKKAHYANEGDFFDVANMQDYKNKFSDSKLSFQDNSLAEIQTGVVFVYHDSVGFNKVVADDIADDYFRLQISKYTFDSRLNDSIFSAEFKLKQSKFLDFFSEEISPLTAVQHNDKDLARYYIASLHQGGALIVLLNLDKRKIDLYRNAGQTNIADELERKLLQENRSIALAFLEENIYNFSAVYVTDAKNRSLILNGETKNMFLDRNLELDSMIVLNESFYLFARSGQVYETQIVDQNNPQRKQVTSTPVVQDAMVIYDRDNIQLMDPFPFYVRSSTAQFASGKQKKSVKNSAVFDKNNDFDNVKSAVAALQNKYNYENIDNSQVGVAILFNKNFAQFYTGILDGKSYDFRQFKWNNKNVWSNNRWLPAPSM